MRMRSGRALVAPDDGAVALEGVVIGGGQGKDDPEAQISQLPTVAPAISTP